MFKINKSTFYFISYCLNVRYYINKQYCKTDLERIT